MKILYAAGNYLSSKFQLQRFLKNFNNHEIKIAAYKKSTPLNTCIDWSLDCLIDAESNKIELYDNENYAIYANMIKTFNPDLIISDLEIFTSIAAIESNIKIIQCSSNLLSFGLKNFDFGISTEYKYLFEDYDLNHLIQNIIQNSNENYIYSHFGDLDYPPHLKENFNWISPYHAKGKISALCEHEAVGITPSFDLGIINQIYAYEDNVLFTDYLNVKNKKNLNNEEEYFCNLKNSKKLYIESNSTFLADAFYNQINPIFSINYLEKDSVLNGQATKYFKLGTNILDPITSCNNNLGLRKNPFLHEIV